MVRSAQTVHLSCVKISTITKRTESCIHLSFVTYEYHQVRPKWFLSIWYIRRKPCTYLASRLALYQMNWIKHPLKLRHLGELSGASKMISDPTVCLAQTMHLSWTDSNTISKCTKTRFHMTHVSLEFHWVRPKWFLRLGYVRHKPCTYLVSRLAKSSKRLNRASTWASSLRSTTRCVRNDFWACGMFGQSYAPILHRHLDCLQMDRNEIPQDPCHLVVPSGVSKMISKPAVRSVQTVHLSCVKISTIFKRTESSIQLRLVT
jgi:hypothetical protein